MSAKNQVKRQRRLANQGSHRALKLTDMLAVQSELSHVPASDIELAKKALARQEQERNKSKRVWRRT